jgi:hypothetical protein
LPYWNDEIQIRKSNDETGDWSGSKREDLGAGWKPVSQVVVPTAIRSWAVGGGMVLRVGFFAGADLDFLPLVLKAPLLSAMNVAIADGKS